MIRLARIAAVGGLLLMMHRTMTRTRQFGARTEKETKHTGTVAGDRIAGAGETPEAPNRAGNKTSLKEKEREGKREETGVRKNSEYGKWRSLKGDPKQNRSERRNPPSLINLEPQVK